MTATSRPRRLVLRLADAADILPIKAFYLERMRHADPPAKHSFPIPSLVEIAGAVDERNFFVLTDEAGTLLAASGLFRLLAHDDGLFLELSGMCTSPEVGGLAPCSVQHLMLLIRIVHAAYDLLWEPLSIASFVHRANRRSHDNLVAAGLREWSDPPEWFEGELVSWFGWDGGDDWLTLLVDRNCVKKAWGEALGLGFFTGDIAFHRPSRSGGETEHFVVRVDWRRFQGQLAGFLSTDLDSLPIGRPPRILRFSPRAD